jgi:hypothetical protein
MPILCPDSFGFGWEGVPSAGQSSVSQSPAHFSGSVQPSQQHFHRHARAVHTDSGFGQPQLSFN